MLIKTIVVGQIETNCHVVTDENTLECAVIDPGDESNSILDYLENNKLKCKFIFLTHDPSDHRLAALAVAGETGACICINEKDSKATAELSTYRFNPPEGSIFYREGDELSVGDLIFRVIETPGHSEGGVTLICGNVLFTGDTLFHSSTGRTDLPGGDIKKLESSLRKLAELPGDYEVYPGHESSSTLEWERRFNPYLRIAMGC